MKQFFLNLIQVAIRNEQKIFSVHVKVGNEKSIPLPDLEFIKTPHLPMVNHTINLVKGDRIHVYKVIEVNHIFHYSGFDLDSGNILVEKVGEKLIY